MGGKNLSVPERKLRAKNFKKTLSLIIKLVNYGEAEVISQKESCTKLLKGSTTYTKEFSTKRIKKGHNAKLLLSKVKVFYRFKVEMLIKFTDFVGRTQDC